MIQGNPEIKRFQVSFNTMEEYQHFVMFLQKFKFDVKDDCGEVSTTSFLQPSSQFMIRSSTLAPAYNELCSQNIFSQPATQAPVLKPMRQTTTVNDQRQENEAPSDFLSQILKPKRKELGDLSDSELKIILNEKLHDIKFISFVERVEKSLHSLNENQ